MRLLILWVIYSPISLDFIMSRIIAVLSRFCSKNNRLVQLTKHCENGKKISWQNTVSFFYLKYSNF